MDEKVACGSQRGVAKPVAWFHAIVIAYANGFDSASVTTATCLRCRKGSAEPDIDRCDTKRGHVRSERYGGKQLHGQFPCWEDSSLDLPNQGEHHR